MSEVKQANFNPIIPAEWQEKYADIKLTKTDTGEYLYGIPKDGGRKVKLKKSILDNAVEEGYSDAFKPEISREELLDQHIVQLENRIQELSVSLERNNKQTAIRLGKIDDVLKLVEKHLSSLGANTVDMRTLLDEGIIHVKEKEAHPAKPAQPAPETKSAKTIEELTQANEAKDARIAELEKRLAEAGLPAPEVVAPAVADPEAPSTATVVEVPAFEPTAATTETSAETVGRYPYRESRLRTFLRRLRRQPAAPEYYEIDESGQRYIIENDEIVYLDEIDRKERNGLIAAIGAVALATLGFGIYTAHEVEEIEHRQSIPARIVPGSIPKTHVDKPKVTVPKENSGKDSVTKDDEDSESSTNAQDRDEPLSGGQSYNENSKKDGHGLQLDIQPEMRVINNADGTRDLKFPNGKTVRLHWNRQGKLTSDTIRTLKENNYEVGQATSSFKDREGRRYQHAYSVVGDQDNH